MYGFRTRLTVAVAVAALALSGCTSTGTNGKAVSTKSGASSTTTKSGASSTTTKSGASSTTTKSGASSTTKTQNSTPAPKASQGFGTKAAAGDVTLGAIRVDPKLGTPSGEVTIVNHSSKLSNYVIDLGITSPDGKTQLDSTVVSAQRLSPGQTVKRSAKFTTKQKLPTGAKLTVIGVARLVA